MRNIGVRDARRAFANAVPGTKIIWALPAGVTPCWRQLVAIGLLL